LLKRERMSIERRDVAVPPLVRFAVNTPFVRREPCNPARCFREAFAVCCTFADVGRSGPTYFDLERPSEPIRGPVTPESDGRRDDAPPLPSSVVALEVALLSSAEHNTPTGAPVALVVVSDDDERTYVADVLRQRADLAVIVVATVAAALEAAAHRTPRVLVATHDARAVVRHLPAVAAVLLSDDTSIPEAADARRLAPIVVLRGAFRGARLLEVVATLIGERARAD